MDKLSSMDQNLAKKKKAVLAKQAVTEAVEDKVIKNKRPFKKSNPPQHDVIPDVQVIAKRPRGRPPLAAKTAIASTTTTAAVTASSNPVIVPSSNSVGVKVIKQNPPEDVSLLAKDNKSKNKTNVSKVSKSHKSSKSKSSRAQSKDSNASINTQANKPNSSYVAKLTKEILNRLITDDPWTSLELAGTLVEPTELVQSILDVLVLSGLVIALKPSKPPDAGVVVANVPVYAMASFARLPQTVDISNILETFALKKENLVNTKSRINSLKVLIL
jgi:hypothetical protein